MFYTIFVTHIPIFMLFVLNKFCLYYIFLWIVTITIIVLIVHIIGIVCINFKAFFIIIIIIHLKKGEERL